MKTFYIICLLLACQSIITGLSAQTVSGKLVDEKNEPMPYANVVLLSLPDSAFVSGTISGDDGTFSLSATAQPQICLLYTSPSPRDVEESRMPSSA